MKFIQNVKANTKPKYFTNYIIILVMLAVTLLMKMTGNLARSNMTLLAQISYSIILAVSLNLVVGFLGELSLGHAGFMCVGAYLGCYAANILHEYIASPLLVLIISMLIGGLIAAVFGFIIGLPALRLKGDYLAIITLGFGEIIRVVLLNIDDVLGFKLTYGAASLKNIPKATTVFNTFLTVGIVIFLIHTLMKSRHGRAILSIRENEIAAEACGIPTTFYKTLGFVTSAFFAGIAGGLYASYLGILSPGGFGFMKSIEILVMVVLGGMGSMIGSVVSATVLTALPEALRAFSDYRMVVYSLLLIVVMIFKPSGLFGTYDFSLRRIIERVYGIVAPVRYKKEDE